MSSGSNRSTYVIGGIVAVVSSMLGFAGMVVWKQWSGSERSSLESPPDVAQRLEPWRQKADTTISIEVHPDEGPTWTIDDDTSVSLALHPSSDSLTWSHQTYQELELIIGRGEWRGHPLVVRWALAPGNPRIRMSLRLSELSPRDLEQSWTAPMVWPLHDATFVDRRLRARSVSESVSQGTRSDALPHTLSAWSAPWLQWRHGEQPLTLTRWTGDGLTLGRDDTKLELKFHLWRPEAHPGWTQCEPDSSTPPSSTSTPSTETADASSGGRARSRTLRAEATFVMGEVPLVVPWRYPEGRLAALAPLLDRPSSHPDETLHPGTPTDVDGWMRRARTVLYGHSNPDDPRFGNGGLLGHDLGGAIALPARFAEYDILREFHRSLHPTRADLALRGEATDHPSSFPIHLTEQPSCPPVGASEDDPPEVIVEGFRPARRRVFDMLTSRADRERPLLSSPTSEAPVSAILPRLDGSRRTLVESILTGPKLRDLVESRGLFAFATPLTGSRNPLASSAQESLVSPERRGHWTLSEPFAASLANLSVMREAVPIRVTSLARLTAYWRRARRLELRWRPNDTIVVHNPTSSPIRNLTLAIGRPSRSRDASDHSESPWQIESDTFRQTRWEDSTGGRLHTWGTIDGDSTATLRLQRTDRGSDVRPPSVRWTIRPQPSEAR